MHTQLGNQINREDKLSIQNLLNAFWDNKITILAITLTCMLLSGIYLIRATPLYEAKGYIIPPSTSDIEQLNYGRSDSKQYTSSVKYIKRHEVFRIFNKALMSESVKQQFFEKFYFPQLNEKEKKIARDKLYEHYSSKINIKMESTDKNDWDVITIKSNSPEKAYKFIQEYLNLAKQQAALEIYNQINSEYKHLATYLKLKIDTARKIAHENRSDRLIQLNEALSIAKAAGIKTELKINSTGWDSIPLMYFRGSTALEAEIDNLKSRKNDDAFIPYLHELESEYALFNNINIPLNTINVFRLDGDIKSPDTAVSPKRGFILIFSLMIGLILSGIVVLNRMLLFK